MATWPLESVAVAVYVVVTDGVTVSVPEGGVTLPTPLSMLMFAALLDVQLSEVLLPAGIHGLEAVRLTITFCTVTVTDDVSTCEFVPLAVAV